MGVCCRHFPYVRSNLWFSFHEYTYCSCSSNSFSYKSITIYSCSEGMITDSHSGVILREMFMNHMKQSIRHNPMFHKLVNWSKYFEGTYAYFTGTIPQNILEILAKGRTYFMYLTISNIQNKYKAINFSKPSNTDIRTSSG